MQNRDRCAEQIPFALQRTAFDSFGDRYEGKVRDCYLSGRMRILIATDRLSAFDRVLTTIPFKGEVLTNLAAVWFRRAEGIIRNHLIDIPDPNVMVAHECSMVPIEMVVRGYLAGSAWRDYQAGRAVSGIRLRPGLNLGDRLDTPVITPSTKATDGSHDEPISTDEIVARGIVSPKLWAELSEKALALFELGTRYAEERGLILVDTKYEFGTLPDGTLVLADEVHTLDSSRYWTLESWKKNSAAPEMLDKEPIRQWLLSKGWQGDGEPPPISDEYRVEVALHYLRAYELITGEGYIPVPGAVEPRIESNISRWLASR